LILAAIKQGCEIREIGAQFKRRSGDAVGEETKKRTTEEGNTKVSRPKKRREFLGVQRDKSKEVISETGFRDRKNGVVILG